MFERHYEDEDLIALLESERVLTDVHLRGCPLCTEKAESFRCIADVLKETEIWDAPAVEVPSAATVDMLRAFADRMTTEDERAAFIVKELLAGPRETWMRRLHERPEWRTAGVVRKLIAAAYDAVVQMPPDAVEIMAVATEIADHLEEQDGTAALHQLRAAAWRDSAYALYYTGRFADALDAIRKAEASLDRCVVDEYERARLEIVEALVLRAFERFAEAEAAAGTSARMFAQFGDMSKVASARMAEVHLLFSRDLYAEAERTLLELERQTTDWDDADMHARILLNLGFSARKLRKYDKALQYYGAASAILRELGAATEVVRAQWGVAAILAEAGRHTDALSRFREITPEMERLEMASEAAIAGLDVSEFLLAQGEYAAVEEICARSIRAFERAGLPYSSRALTAMAYMQEAAAQRRADRQLVRTVRDYIRRLPAQPNLLFAIPPQ